MRTHKKIYNIKDIVDNVVDSMDILPQSNQELFSRILETHIDNDLKEHVSVYKQEHATLLLRVTHNVIFSEIIGFRQYHIKKTLLGALAPHGILDIRFICYT